jgi:acyl-CoA synthetase (NDP forming)
MRNLIQGGFAGEIFPINPKHSEIMKMPAYPSVKDNCSNVVCQLRRNAELKK